MTIKVSEVNVIGVWARIVRENFYDINERYFQSLRGVSGNG